jgi:hypothetical protein
MGAAHGPEENSDAAPADDASAQPDHVEYMQPVSAEQPLAFVVTNNLIVFSRPRLSATSG